MATSIRAGIGGWDYAPWRETFYWPDVPQKKALAYASRAVTSIEIDDTHYRTAKPEHFASWHPQTPDDFVFSVKASRYASNRRALAEAGESVERFPASLPLAGTAKHRTTTRDAFISFINGGRERAPAAAQHLIGLL